MGTEPKMSELPTCILDFGLPHPISVLPRVFGGGFYAQKFSDKLLPGLNFEDKDMRYSRAIRGDHR